MTAHNYQLSSFYKICLVQVDGFRSLDELFTYSRAVSLTAVKVTDHVE